MNETQTTATTTVQEFDEAAEASRPAINNPICPRCIGPHGQWRGNLTSKDNVENSVTLESAIVEEAV